jgi:hypothetical protein
MPANGQQYGCLPGGSAHWDEQAVDFRCSDSEWPRYSSRPLPAYRFVPGVTPHPRRHPGGHSYGEPEPAVSAPGPDQWQSSEAYLYGVDLYNFAFWWECHEVFEGFWRAAPKTEEGGFFQALIHVAAANLKICMGSPASADRLSLAAFERFHRLPHVYMGIDLRSFERDIRAYVVGSRTGPAPIRLLTSADKGGTHGERPLTLSLDNTNRSLPRPLMDKECETMGTVIYPRSPKLLLGGLAHLGRLIDKIRLRHAGQIQDYNYLTAGFDKSLLELLGLNGEAFECRVLEGGTDDDIVRWVNCHASPLSEKDIQQWNDRIFTSSPQDDGTRQRFQARLSDIAAKRGVSVNALPPVTTWADVIELDEGRL